MSNGVMFWGNKKINPSVSITLAVNDTISFNVDGVPYSITLDQGTYNTVKESFTSDLVAQINTKLSAAGVPVKARLGGIMGQDGATSTRHIDVLVFEHTDTTASHIINNFGGSGILTIFGDVFIVYPNQP